MNDKHYQKIFDEFKEDHPNLVSNLDRWEGRNLNTIRLFFKDGTRNIYNYIMKGLGPDRPNNGSEADWRRDFRDILIEKMYDHGYTQQTLAEKAGVSQLSISKYLNKKVIPSAYTICKLAKALDCSPNDLMWFEED